MNKHVKSFLYEAGGAMLIATSAMTSCKISDAGLEGPKYWLMVVICGALYPVGIKLIQRGKK